MVTAGGPRYGPLLEMDAAQVRQALSEHVVVALEVARHAAGKIRHGGTLVLMGGTGARRIGHGLGITSAATAALPTFTAALALELALVRVNLIAAGFVDTPLSAALLGNRLEERRKELCTTLPIGRVVGHADVAALAVHIMTNAALTGATYDIDGRQQFRLLVGWTPVVRPEGGGHGVPGEARHHRSGGDTGIRGHPARERLGRRLRRAGSRGASRTALEAARRTGAAQGRRPVPRRQRNVADEVTGRYVSAPDCLTLEAIRAQEAN
jgi:hypothetical protein